MQQEDKILFSLLKKEIAQTMMQTFPGTDSDVSMWKGQTILDFQEDLSNRINGQLSEKWFYTHMKASNPNLPRIDVLNLLSRYAGYLNWQDFRHKNINHISFNGKTVKSISPLFRITIIFVAVMALLFIILKLINTQNYRFTFIDSDTGEPITGIDIKAELLMEDESNVNHISDEKGIITVRTGKSRVSMIIKAPYYLTDTVRRTLKKFSHDEQISLRADYYALMISYFSRSDVNSWEKRREQLGEMISDDAMIYQSPDKNTGTGIAIYNKWEFIDKLTMPASGLKQIEILDCRYIDGKIAVFRFRIKPE